MSNIAVHIPKLSLERRDTLPQQTSAGSIGKQYFFPILLSFPFRLSRNTTSVEGLTEGMLAYTYIHLGVISKVWKVTGQLG